MLHWCFSPGANRLPSPLLAHAQGVGLLFLLNFKEPLTREITFLLVYLFIDLPSKVKGEKRKEEKPEEREMKK